MTQRSLFCTLKVYVGQTRSRSLLAKLSTLGIGECVTRGQLPPRRTPWFYDNGAFEDFTNERPFDYLQWSRDMRAIRLWQDREGIPWYRPNGRQRLVAPDFQVLPDMVGAGEASLEFSIDHLVEAQRSGAPCYLAVQDGMSLPRVEFVLRTYRLAGIFVGGSLEWKLATAARWCALGRRLQLPVHVGRVGTLERVAWAQEIGATSIDSSFPLWTSDRLDAFLAEVA